MSQFVLAGRAAALAGSHVHALAEYGHTNNYVPEPHTQRYELTVAQNPAGTYRHTSSSSGTSSSQHSEQDARLQDPLCAICCATPRTP